VIGLNDGAGARIQEGVVSLASYGGIFYRNVLVLGRGAADLGDPRPVRRRRRVQPGHDRLHLHGARVEHMFITGPDVVKTVTGEEVTLEELGGAMSHASKSGCRHVRERRREGLPRRRALPAQLPAERTTSRSRRPRHRRSPDRLCPELDDPAPSPNQPYDMRKVIATVVDDGEFFEYFPALGQSIVCGFAARRPARRHRRQPADGLAGVLDIESSSRRPRSSSAPATRSTSRCHLRRRARLPARRRPGVRRHHPPRREAALRLLRGHRAAHPGDHPQGLRRRVRGDGLEVDRFRPRLRLAVRRAGGDGPVRARSRS
jgi:hypothetical protein